MGFSTAVTDAATQVFWGTAGFIAVMAIFFLKHIWDEDRRFLFAVISAMGVIALICISERSIWIGIGPALLTTAAFIFRKRFA